MSKIEFPDDRWMARDALIATAVALVTACAVGFRYDFGSGVLTFIAVWLVVMFTTAQIRLRQKNNVSLFAIWPDHSKIRIELFESEPTVIWWQALPYHSGQQREAWGCWIRLGIVLVILCSISETVRTVIGSLVLLAIGGFILTFFFEKFMKIVTRGRWKEKPTLKTLRANATIYRRGESDMFMWQYNTVDETAVSGCVPLNSFKSFEITTSDEWFAALHEPKPDNPYFIILINTPDGGPQMVAAHAGSRSEIAELHAILTRLFVTNRARHLNNQHQSSQPQTGPVDRSDLPDTI